MNAVHFASRPAHARLRRRFASLRWPVARRLKPEASPPPPAFYSLDCAGVGAPRRRSARRAIPATRWSSQAPHAAAGYDSQHIIYVRQPHKLEYFAHNEWVDPPARMLAPLIVAALERQRRVPRRGVRARLGQRRPAPGYRGPAPAARLHVAAEPGALHAARLPGGGRHAPRGGLARIRSRCSRRRARTRTAAWWRPTPRCARCCSSSRRSAPKLRRSGSRRAGLSQPGRRAR